MDYGPNVGALTRFVERILPVILERRPDVHLSIVGRSPVPEIQALASEHVTVTGGVPDVRPWLARASALVVPLLIGGGTRLKIVEAMAMDCPVVSTTVGAEGLGLQHREHLLLADGTEDFARAVLELLDAPGEAGAMARRARSYVEDNLTWQTLAERLVSVWRRVAAEHSPAS
jgi:glycosyltransferase involved in cell wall biosynthesis